VSVFLYLFDVLVLEGQDVTRLPLRERKRLLAEAVDFADPTRATPAPRHESLNGQLTQTQGRPVLVDGNSRDNARETGANAIGACRLDHRGTA
jgi:hypothetical protein